MNNKHNGLKISIFVITLLVILVGGFFLVKWSSDKNKNDKLKVDTPKYSDATPLLYKASDGKTDIYLLGSIHAADDSAYEFNQNIINYFDKADALAVEFDIIAFNNNLKAQMEILPIMMYDDGTTLKDHMDEKLYNDLVNLLKSKKLYNEMYELYKPMFWESLIENSLITDAKLDTEKGIDMYFLRKAKKDKKEIIEIESAEFQYNMMSNFPEFITYKSIEDTIKNYDEAVEDLKELYSIWKEGNADKVVEILLEEPEDVDAFTPEQLADLEEYNKAMLTDRNINMAKVLENNIKNGTSVFCVVGLAHIVGDGGIVDLLQKQGYTVELVDYSS